MLFRLFSSDDSFVLRHALDTPLPLPNSFRRLIERAQNDKRYVRAIPKASKGLVSYMVTRP
jgi:hypothetical protein